MINNVLSLFDGCSIGYEALKAEGIVFNKYFASEIDKNAIKVSKENFPEIVHLGDVKNIGVENVENIDLLIGGSPCQGFSTIGKQLNFEDERSALFFEFIRLKKLLKPKWFLLENVPMKKEWAKLISDFIEVDFVEINSKIVSAQSRRRLYWTNIPIQQIKEKNVFLDDIIDSDLIIDAPKNFAKRVPLGSPKYIDPYNQKAITGGKSTTLRTNINNGNMWVRMNNGEYRNLTLNECRKLQTTEIDFSCVSEQQAKKMLGNGWTTEIIQNIFKGLKNAKD